MVRSLHHETPTYNGIVIGSHKLNYNSSKYKPDYHNDNYYNIKFKTVNLFFKLNHGKHTTICFHCK